MKPQNLRYVAQLNIAWNGSGWKFTRFFFSSTQIDTFFTAIRPWKFIGGLLTAYLVRWTFCLPMHRHLFPPTTWTSTSRPQTFASKAWTFIPLPSSRTRTFPWSTSICRLLHGHLHPRTIKICQYTRGTDICLPDHYCVHLSVVDCLATMISALCWALVPPLECSTTKDGRQN